MKIPKKIEKLIYKRIKLACELDDVCSELDEWLEKHNINTENEDTHGGVEIYVNPHDSGERIINAILEKQPAKGEKS